MKVRTSRYMNRI